MYQFLFQMQYVGLLVVGCRKCTVKKMADRILLMRQLLFDKLKELGVPGTWDHIVQQTGMFSYTGLSGIQISLQNGDLQFLKILVAEAQMVCVCLFVYVHML